MRLEPFECEHACVQSRVDALVAKTANAVAYADDATAVDRVGLDEPRVLATFLDLSRMRKVRVRRHEREFLLLLRRRWLLSLSSRRWQSSRLFRLLV